MSPDANTTKRYRWMLLFVIAILFAYVGPRFWQRVEINPAGPAEAYENSDLYTFYYPSLHYGFDRLRQAEIPLWNDRQLCGTPWAADPRNGLYQPLRLLFLLFPTREAMALHAFLALFLAGVFVSLFLRSLGLGYLAGVLGAVVYTFSGAMASGMSRPPTAEALAWAPLVFWMATEYTRRFRLSAAIACGAAVGGLLLSGAYALCAVFLCVLVPFLVQAAVYPANPLAPRVGRRAAGCVLIAFVAAAVSCAQWANTVPWLFTLEAPWRALWRLDVAGQVPTQLRELPAHLLTATPGPLPRVAYVGIATLVLIPAACFHRRQARHVLFFGLCGTALLIAYALLLWVGGDAFPAHALLFAIALCLATLAALGTDRLLVPRRAQHVSRMWPAALAALVTATLVFIVSASQGRGYAIAFASVLLLLMAFRVRWIMAIGGTLWLLLLLSDLIMASHSAYRHPYQDAPQCYDRYAQGVEAAREEILGARVLTSARNLDVGLPANMGLLGRFTAVEGAGLPLTPQQATWWKALGDAGRGCTPEAAAPSLLNQMAARIVLATPEGALYDGVWKNAGPRLRIVRHAAGVRLFVNDDALPRAYWVPKGRAVSGIEEAIAALTDTAFDTNTTCVLDAATLSPENATLVADAQAPQDPTKTRQEAVCSVEDAGAERVVVRVDAPQAGVTILADTFAPGWQARLDGMPAPILRANGLFRGVATPEGHHEIVFEYAPTPYRAGYIVSIASLVALAIAGLIAFAKGV